MKSNMLQRKHTMKIGIHTKQKSKKLVHYVKIMFRSDTRNNTECEWNPWMGCIPLLWHSYDCRICVCFLFVIKWKSLSGIITLMWRHIKPRNRKIRYFFSQLTHFFYFLHFPSVCIKSDWMATKRFWNCCSAYFPTG